LELELVQIAFEKKPDPARIWFLTKNKGSRELFGEKMTRLTAKLKGRFARSTALEERIKLNLAGAGYEL
jgi:hypothetical protein